MSTDAKTPYLDLHHRVIYKSARGAYYVKDAAGKKYYGVKARYVAVANGTSRKLTTKNTSPPNKIKPKRIAAPVTRTSTRKVRSNKGVKRGPYKPRATAAAKPMSSGKAMNVLKQTRLASRLRKVTFTFTPEVGGMYMRNRALKWYKSMVADVEAGGEIKVLDIQPYGNDDIAVTFRFQPAWAMRSHFRSMAREIKSAAEGFIDVDQDGNNPIIVNGEPEIVGGVFGRVISIE